jgi:Golgi SNAP receptor complex protein 2
VNGLGAAEQQKNVVAKQLEELQRVCRELEGQSAMIGMTSSYQNQNVWKKKIDQVVEETGVLQRSFDRWCGGYRALSMEEEQRQELFLLRRKGGQAFGAGDIESSSFKDKERIRRSKQVVEEAYQNGVGALVAMAQQRDVLKNAHRKVLDVLNTIGMSDSVLRIAERRISVDKMIAYGGMALVILFLVLVWWFR